MLLEVKWICLGRSFAMGFSGNVPRFIKLFIWNNFVSSSVHETIHDILTITHSCHCVEWTTNLDSFYLWASYRILNNKWVNLFHFFTICFSVTEFIIECLTNQTKTIRFESLHLQSIPFNRWTDNLYSIWIFAETHWKMGLRHVRFIARTVLVKNNNIEQANGVLNRILNNEGIFAQYRRMQYYEKATHVRRRINYERCKAFYNEDMSARIALVMRKNRVDPFPGSHWDISDIL